MLINIEINNYLSFDLAFVQWYDFRYKNDLSLYKYDCFLLQLTNIYNIIPVKLFIELVYIIQHSKYPNEYFINIYMF